MIKTLDHIVEAVCALVAVALTVTVFIQVFNRFILETPLAWSEDLAMLLFQWMVFLGAALGVRRMRHFGIELLVRQLPARAQQALALAVPVLIGLVALIMVSQGLTLLSFNMNRMYGTMTLSYTWAYLPIPVSGTLILIYLIPFAIQRWKGPSSRRS